MKKLFTLLLLCLLSIGVQAQLKPRVVIMHFVENVHVVKDNMFPIPPLFRTIQEQSHTEWSEMYKVFNCGHRFEVYLPQEYAQQVIDISQSFGIDARVIGHIEASDHTHLTIHSEYGTFEY